VKYTSDNIHLSGELEHIRNNVHYYAGEHGTEDPTHLLFEALDNALDEIGEGYADTITISINEKTKTVTIQDNGRGIPVDKKIGTDQYVPFLISTKLFSSGKGKNQKNKGYKKPTSGLHGIGMTLVNALSKVLVFQVFKDGTEYRFTLKDGIAQGREEFKCDTKLKGTVVNFLPDEKYFEKMQLNYTRIEKRLVGINHSLQGKLKNINYFINNKQKKLDLDYCKFRFGIPKGPLWIKIDSAYELESFKIEMTWSTQELRELINKKKNASTSISSIINHLVLEEGTHLNFAYDMIKEGFMRIAKKEKYDIIKSDDIKKGLRVLVIGEFLDKSFNSQDKIKLTTKRQYFVERFGNLSDLIYDKMYNDKSVFELLTKPLLDILQDYRLSIDTNIKKGEIKAGGKVGRSLDVEGLHDCSSMERNKCSLYIVEGESAGGNVLQIRDDNIHAVQFLSGKIANVTSAKIDKILNNKVIRAMIDTIGVGYRHKSTLEDINNIRYNNIVILTDADPDGKEIEALLVLAFVTLMPTIIEYGILKIAKQPLYGARSKSSFIPIYKKYMTKTTIDDDGNVKNSYIPILDADGKPTGNYELDPIYKKYDSDKRYKMKRFKGLGEMEPEDLKATLFSKHAEYTVVKMDNTNNNEYLMKMMNDPETKRKFMSRVGIYERTPGVLLDTILSNN